MASKKAAAGKKGLVAARNRAVHGLAGPDEPRADAVYVELDDEEGSVSPTNVDAVAFLRVAESYLWLVSRLGQLRDRPVTLTGIKVVDKCAAISTNPTDLTRAVYFCREATLIVSGAADAPHGAEKAADAAREALLALPKTTHARVLAGPYVGELSAPAEEVLRDHPWQQTQLRATIVRAGGRKPVAQFQSVDDGAFFTLDLASEAKARELGQHLYKECDLEALILRGAEGGIERGELIDLVVLGDAEPAGAWRAWFAQNAAEDWSDVDDVVGELGRDDD